MTDPKTHAQVEILLPAVWKARQKAGVSSLAWLASPKRTVVGVLEDVSQRKIGSIRKLLIAESGERILIYSGTTPAISENYDRVIFTKTFEVSNDFVVLSTDATWKKHPKIMSNDATWDGTQSNEVFTSWAAGISYRSEANHGTGLRTPQLGALHAISSHWTLSNSSGIAVMPTGTGKTEVMLAIAVGERCRSVLVIVPSDALRTQTAEKFESLGILKQIGVVGESFEFPIVARLSGNPKSIDDLVHFEHCNVIIATMQSLSNTEDWILKEISDRCSHLFFDEAHHTPAHSWSRLKSVFSGKPILQFTATPFRRDGKRLDGKILYSYPLAKAQEEGYFKPIRRVEVFEWDDENADREIAKCAIETLRQDLANGLNHMILARVESIDRAEYIFSEHYSKHADLQPVVVHQKSPNRKRIIQDIKNKKHRIIVCVDMLGEGFDLPNLKISAIHDAHKSLGVTLQFAGRFTRSNANDIGDATVIANFANQQMSESIESLYEENADWNKLLADLSQDAIDPQIKFSEFHDQVRAGTRDGDAELLSDRLLEPKTSTVVYHADNFSPAGFSRALYSDRELIGSWQNQTQDVLMFVTKKKERLIWARTKSVTDDIHDLFVVFYDKVKKLLFIHSSAKSDQKRLANAVSKDPKLVNDEEVFRVLGRIERLLFYNAGLLGGSRGGIRFQMLSGLDVAQAIDPAAQQHVTKSNLFGVGYEDGERVSIGCSRKGTIWSMQSSSIPEWRTWCKNIGKKLIDSSIATDEYLKHTLIPKLLDRFPVQEPLCLEWPFYCYELLPKELIFSDGSKRFSWLDCELRVTEWNRSNFRFELSNIHGDIYDLSMTLDSTKGVVITSKSPYSLIAIAGSSRHHIIDFFEEYRPVVRMPNGGQIDGQRLLEPRDTLQQQIDPASLIPYDWKDVPLNVESMWKHGSKRPKSIQGFVIDQLSPSPDTVLVIDDDDTGEIADIIAVEERGDEIHVHLVHCKYTKAGAAGSRVEDFYVVCGQAQKAINWSYGFERIAKQIAHRETNSKNGRPTRFHKGDLKLLERIRRKASKSRVVFRMSIVQPGISKSAMLPEHSSMLGATSLFLRQHLGSTLEVWVSP